MSQSRGRARLSIGPITRELEIEEKAIRLAAMDGEMIAGRIFTPELERRLDVATLIVGGAGIPARVYRHFARFLANEGIDVLTFDFRGIAESRPKRLRGYVATAEDWSEYDCGGAIGFLAERYPNARLCAIGHSIGGFLVGGAANANAMSRIVFVGAHSGYFGDYRGKFRVPMSLVWHAAMPLITRVVGYFPASALRLGEDIPAGFAMQWAARRTPDFRPSVKGKQYERATAMLKRYEELHGTALALVFSDDAFGTNSGLLRLLAIYPRLETTIEEITPGSGNMERIGHIGFFRPDAAATLWPKVRDFITSES